MAYFHKKTSHTCSDVSFWACVSLGCHRTRNGSISSFCQNIAGNNMLVVEQCGPRCLSLETSPLKRQIKLDLCAASGSLFGITPPPLALSLSRLPEVQGQTGNAGARNNGGNGWAARLSCCGNFERMMCYTPPYLLLWWALDISHYLLHNAEKIVEVTQIRWRGQMARGGEGRQRDTGDFK